jgi:hypothetical protein
MSKKLRGVTLLPTGTCFDDAADYINHLVISTDDAGIHKLNTKIKIVHAICTLENGEPYAHAWLEVNGTCYFGAILEHSGEKVQARVPKEEYYPSLGIQKKLYYSLKESVRLEKIVHGYPGPWDPEIRNLCGDIKRERAKNLLSNAVRQLKRL